ncbi:methylenetetrahydrofolate reductase [Candidatus Bathyarchaeota archaeon]|nr:methylenetetrahydrofolate reductase [Candidatus Bathyarchaeota archaeon]
MAKQVYSELMKSITEGKFIFTGEIEPVKTTDLHEVIETAKILKGHVVAVNITDNPTAFAYMNSLIPSYVIQRDVGLEAVYQMVSRDRNRIALTSDLLAAGYLGIKNVLALSGDHTTVGDNPGAKPVYDLDSTGLLYLIRKMVDEGVDLAGNKIDKPPKFHVGIAAALGADPIEPELLKIERKVKIGVDFIQTQAAYDIEVAKRFLKLTEHLNVPTLIGIAPLKSIPMLDWMVKFVPGIVIPKEFQDRLRKAKEKGGKEAIFQENIEFFGEFVKEIRATTHAAGIHIMAIGFEWIVPKIIERAGLKTID